MREWKMTVTSGARLRDAIKSGESAEILQMICKCCDEVQRRYKKNSGICDEFEELNELVSGEVEACEQKRYDEIASWGFQLGPAGIVELVDDRLAQFYDLCDANSFFVDFSRRKV